MKVIPCHLFLDGVRHTSTLDLEFPVNDMTIGPWYRGRPEALQFEVAEINTVGNYTGSQSDNLNVGLCTNSSHYVGGLCGGIAVNHGSTLTISGNISYCDGKPVVGATVDLDVFRTVFGIGFSYGTCANRHFTTTTSTGSFNYSLIAVDRPQYIGLS